MPAHDWTRMRDTRFHDFHVEWLLGIKHALNRVFAGGEYYAAAEQHAGGPTPNVLTLMGAGGVPRPVGGGGVALATRPPALRRILLDYAQTRQKSIVVRHVSGDQVVSVLEVLSPGNKSGRRALDMFLTKAESYLRRGVHFSYVDLFPPTPRDPFGVNAELWGDDEDHRCTAQEPLGCGAYVAEPMGEGFFQPFAVGAPMPELPVFLTPEHYVPVDLDATYAAAFEGVPEAWRRELPPL